MELEGKPYESQIDNLSSHLDADDNRDTFTDMPLSKKAKIQLYDNYREIEYDLKQKVNFEQIHEKIKSKFI